MLIRNDGLEDRHLALPADDPQREPLIIDGRRRTGEYFTQLEDLLDITERSGTPPQRLDRLRATFVRGPMSVNSRSQTVKRRRGANRRPRRRAQQQF
jgi:hypothetical protein